MGLNDFRRLFFAKRGSCEVLIQKHAFRDYPERGFSEREIMDLIRKGIGRIEDNRSSQAIDNSFLFSPKDALGRKCKLVVLIETVEIDGNPAECIVVCSAFREAGS